MITLESINAINQQYLQRMNEIEVMKVQTKRVPDDIEFKQKVAEIMRDRPIMWVECRNCSGEGRIGKKDGQTVRDCPECDGTGEVPVYADDGLEVFQDTKEE